MLKVSYTTFYQKKAIIDANVLIDLSEIGALDLINRVFSVVGIPEDIIHFELEELDLGDVHYVAVNISSVRGMTFLGCSK